MGSTKKSTRKFEKNHLKDTLERRKGVAKIKQRQHVKEKRKARKAKEEDAVSTARDEDAVKNSATGARGGQTQTLDEMDVDEFFQGGFEIAQMSDKKPSRKRAARDAPTAAAPPKPRKRKRDETQDATTTTTTGTGDVVSSSQEEEEVEAPLTESDSGDDDLEAHKRDLRALAAKDPEFYKYLEENDAELLNVPDHPDLSEDDQPSDGEEIPQVRKAKRKIAGDATEEIESEDGQDGENGEAVTMGALAKWRKAMVELHSLRAMKEVILAFRAAAHVNEDDGKEYKYTISSPEVYHELLLLALKEIPVVLAHYLPVRQTQSGKIRITTDSKKFRNTTPLLKSHAASAHHLLSTLSDDATIRLTLSSFVPLLPYLLSFKKLLRGIVKTVVGIWSNTASTEATRISAFLVVRRLAVIGDAGLREMVLRSVYQGLVKGSRSTSVHTLPGVNLMKNSAAELWGLDPSVGYTTGFAFIRQLAIHLRGSITNSSKDSYRAVYNWQYVHSLDFWSRVLTLHCAMLREAETGKEFALKPLIYPLVQITLGTLRLIPTAQYFPLRFQLTRALLRLSGPTGIYIPLAPALLEVLSSAEMKRAPKPSTLKGLDFATTIRAPKAYLRTRVYQDGIGEQVGELLSEFLVQWTKSIAFPELALPVVVMLKRWLKEVSSSSHRGNSSSGAGNKNNKLNSAMVLLVQKLEANSRWIDDHRAKVDFAPNDRAGVESFLADTEWTTSPLGAFVVGQRKQREERERLIEKGRREEEKRMGVERRERDEDDEDVDMDIEDASGDEDVDEEEDEDEDEE
ncbi:MAG: Nucleolar Complex 2 protein [Peltula sp. TS41687]|nr:MAG: Nucleolar Complex 2 protein [Peltula sp. TS41687]